MARPSFANYDERDLVDRQTAAGLLGVSKSALEAWATRGGGPPFVKMGEARRSPVAYQVRDLLAWVEERRQRSTTTAS